MPTYIVLGNFTDMASGASRTRSSAKTPFASNARRCSLYWDTGSLFAQLVITSGPK
jgi:hypothetical protein